MTIALKLKGIRKSFGGHHVIDGLKADFVAQRITGLIGPNGAGKTTLFHLITNELTPDEGKILFKGKDITGLPTYKIARLGIGKMFQDIRIFKNIKVIENIIVSLQDKADESLGSLFISPHLNQNAHDRHREQAEEVLEFIGLSDKIDELAGALSYGQQKLLGLGRLLAADSELLLLDEPTAGINPSMITRILELLENMVKERGKTIIIVEHDMQVIKDIASWVLFMNEGRIAFTGSTDHVLGAKKVRKMYLGLPGE